MLCLERKRTERSGRHFLLMLLDASKLLKRSQQSEALEQIFSALASATRDTDVKGWYTEGSIIGVIFTEIGSSNAKHVKKTLFAKVAGALSAALGVESARRTSLTFYIFPEEWDKGQPVEPQSLRLYPDLVSELERNGASRLVKRSIDLAGSLFGLMLANAFVCDHCGCRETDLARADPFPPEAARPVWKELLFSEIQIDVRVERS
jgi:hypothetical protein